MTSFEQALTSIARDLDSIGIPWALVGALAVAARAEARATFDVDVALAVSDRDEAAKVVAELTARGYRWQSDFGNAMTSFEVPGPLSGLRLDLLFALAGVEAEVARRAERLEILPRLVLPVARLGDLIALKLLGAGEPGREHDWRDLRSLGKRAVHQDLELARQVVGDLVVRNPGQAEALESNLARFLAERPVGQSTEKEQEE